MNNKDDRSTDDLLLEEGNHSGTRPNSACALLSFSAGRIRHPLFAAVGLLLLVSVVSSIIVLLNIERAGSILGELGLDLLNQESFDPGWRLIPTTVSTALEPLNNTERLTLAETFFTPECAEAWVATDILCKQITAGKITPDMRNSLKLSIIYTWVNGSDQRLKAWKEALIQDQRPATIVGKKLPGEAARHFRYFVLY
jgi:hypothetical protein